MISHFRSIWLADSMNLRFRIRRFSSFLLDISSEYINTTKCRNQKELAEKMKNKLTTKEAYTSFQAIDRALFLPKTEYREPYVNEPQNLGFSEATLSTPYHHALILSILHETGLKSGKRVIDIGCGSGYLTAAIYRTVGKTGLVVGMERIPELVNMAKTCLKDCPITKEAQDDGSLKVIDAYDERGNWTIARYKPYDIIHVGFSFNPDDSKSIEVLTSCLRQNEESRMLAGFGEYLCLFDHKGYRKEIASIPGMAKFQQGKYQKVQTRGERIKEIKDKLDAWKSDFEGTHGRKPNKEDMFSDETSRALFQEFSGLTKLS